MRRATSIGPSFLVLSAALLVPAVLLRLWRLRSQVLGGDEMHAVRVALGRPLSEILVTYSVADNCIPLTALYRLVTDLGGELSETVLRLPMLAAGIAFLVLGTLAVTRWRGRETGLAFLALGAINPTLVFYSRFVRSYMPMVLLTALAAWCFFEWWRSGERRLAVGAAGGGALAIWFHLGAGPIVAAPFLWAGASKLLPGTRPGRSWKELFAVGLGLAGGVALFLLPARNSLERLVRSKRVDASPRPGVFAEAAQLQAGTGSELLAGIFWALALVGLVLLWRSRPALAGFGTTLVAIHLLGVLLLSPLGIAHPLVVNRYLAPVVPWTLLWVAEALGCPWRSLRVRRSLPGLVGAAAGIFLPVALLFTGPFPDRRFLAGSFAHHNDLIWFTRPEPRLPLDAVPGPYRWLARRDGSDPILEFPWINQWNSNRTFAAYQEIHGRDVVTVVDQDVYWDPRLDLRNTVTADPGSILASRGRWLFVHRRIDLEEESVEVDGRRGKRFVEKYEEIVRRHEGFHLRLRELWGPPEVGGGGVLVWDLDAVRGASRTDGR